MVAHFKDDWVLSMDALSTLPVEDLAKSLKWDDYEERL